MDIIFVQTHIQQNSENSMEGLKLNPLPNWSPSLGAPLPPPHLLNPPLD